MLDIVAPQENELALAIEVIDVDDAQAGLPSASAVLPRHGEAAARETADRQRRQRQDGEDDHEGDQVINYGRSFDAEFGQHDVILWKFGRPREPTRRTIIASPLGRGNRSIRWLTAFRLPEP